MSPIQLISGVSSIVNGGIKISPTLVKQGKKRANGRKILSSQASLDVRRLMRLVVKQGTGKKAKTEGYLLGGKTGTANKLQGRGYSSSAKISSFIGSFPMDSPKYTVLIIVDEPKGNKETFHYATGGWVAAPTVGRIVNRIGPILGIAPAPEVELDLPKIEKVKRRKIQAKKPQKLFKKVNWSLELN